MTYVRSSYANGICLVGNTRVEFKNYLALVPDHISSVLVSRPGYSLLRKIVTQEEKDKQYYSFNLFLQRIKQRQTSYNLLITSSIGKVHQELAEVTIPTFQKYCIKYNIDFVHVTLQDPNLTPYWQRYRFAELLSHYKRIIYMDNDILIKPTSPNLLDLVPEDYIALYKEGQYKTDFMDRPSYCAKCYRIYLTEVLKRQYDSKVYISENYYNNGIVIFSQQHNKLFKIPIIDDPSIDWYHDPYTKGSENACGDQTNLNINIIDNKYKVYELSSPIVGMWDRCKNYDYLDCEIIHFAWGNLDSDKIQKIKNIRDSFYK